MEASPTGCQVMFNGVTAARSATSDDVRAIAAALARSFDDDPVMRYLFPKDRSRPQRLRTFFAAETKRALRQGAVFTADDASAEGASKGGAVWSAPGKWKVVGAEMVAQLPLLFTFAAAMPRAVSLMTRVEKAHPQEHHWYLAALGTVPDHQGKGIGSALLAPILGRCDEEGQPAYLESSKEQNIPFYNRHGFEVTGEIAMPNGPTMWTMWRDPRPG
jgi:ribosomal protein S18 acetylase RimI-like enzyme